MAEYNARHPRPAEDREQSCEGTEAATDHRLGCAAMLGEAKPRAAVDLRLPGADQLSLDGLSRREVHHYPRKKPADEREWRMRQDGGYHGEWRGRGEAWLWWARQHYSFDDQGWLQGRMDDPNVPRAAVFWVACEQKLRCAKRTRQSRRSAPSFSTACSQ